MLKHVGTVGCCAGLALCQSSAPTLSHSLNKVLGTSNNVRNTSNHTKAAAVTPANDNGTGTDNGNGATHAENGNDDGNGKNSTDLSGSNIANSIYNNNFYGPEENSSRVKKPWLGKQMLAEDESFLKRITKGNSNWVESKNASFFADMAQRDQRPICLYIGCSDSRVPAETMLGFELGELFVHRNIANMVINTDMSFLSVLQYSVEVLKVKHIIVCGHYGCGGVKASMTHRRFGLIDNWLRNIRDVQRVHMKELEQIQTEEQRYRRLVELNVAEQVINVYKSGFVQKGRINYGWPRVHGMVYDMATGRATPVPVDVNRELSTYRDIYSLYDIKSPPSR